MAEQNRCFKSCSNYHIVEQKRKTGRTGFPQASHIEQHETNLSAHRPSAVAKLLHGHVQNVADGIANYHGNQPCGCIHSKNRVIIPEDSPKFRRCVVGFTTVITLQHAHVSNHDE